MIENDSIVKTVECEGSIRLRQSVRLKTDYSLGVSYRKDEESWIVAYNFKND